MTKRLSLWFLFLAPAVFAAAEPKTILFFGDSLTAGYGLDDPAAESFPGIIQNRIEGAGLPYRVVNAGLSGETTAGGLRRVDWVLRQPVHIFVLGLGGNDGLRGVPVSASKANLRGIIEKVRTRNPDVTIVLAGMQMPRSLGPDYTRDFAGMYPEIADSMNVTLVPFLLEGVGGDRSLNLPDGIHPNAEGHRKVAGVVWDVLQPLL